MDKDYIEIPIDERIQYTCPNCGEENIVDVLDIEGSTMQVE